MPATILSPKLASMSLQQKRDFVTQQIEAHRNGGVLTFSKTY